MKHLIAQFGAYLFYFTKNALHLKKSIMLRPKSRLKDDFFNEKAAKNKLKLGKNRLKTVDFFSKKTDYFDHP